MALIINSYLKFKTENIQDLVVAYGHSSNTFRYESSKYHIE